MAEWKQWLSTPLSTRHNLPSQPGIYVIVDAEEQVWYVGLSTNLNARWSGKRHHRYKQLNRVNSKRGYRIHWHIFPVEQLIEKERYYINYFKPHLNYTRVRTYARQARQPHQELKRIFKVINKNTLLFPEVRSVVLGYYSEQDEDDTGVLKDFICVVTAISVNDHDSVIFNSINKSLSKKGIYLKDCWRYYTTNCGEIDTEFDQINIPVFLTNELVYEFICPLVLNNRITQYQDKLFKVNLVQQPVLALKDLDILPTLLASDKPKFLHDKYLDYRAPDLRPIAELLGDSAA